jgi:hypothetical protein
MPIDEMVQIEDKDDLTNCPVPNRSYKIPQALLPSLEKFIAEMKNSGWIEDSKSEFCRPVLIIPKGLPHENKDYHFVVDLRQLNARTKSLQYMVPELGEMWAKLRNAKFISKLDLRHGFWQMGLHPNSMHKTSFSCEYGTFQYRVLPMGLLLYGGNARGNALKRPVTATKQPATFVVRPWTLCRQRQECPGLRRQCLI